MITEQILRSWERLWKELQTARNVVSRGIWGQYPGQPGWQEHCLLDRLDNKFNRWARVAMPLLLEEVRRLQARECQ